MDKPQDPHDHFPEAKQQLPLKVGGELRCRACKVAFPGTAGGELAHIGHWYDVGKERLNR